MTNQANKICLHTVIEYWATASPQAIALAAPKRSPLTYDALFALVEGIVAYLRMRGIGLTDRVAIALPQGPMLAAACLSVASGAIAAPLNPNAAQASDFELLFDEIEPAALIVQQGIESLARNVAVKRGIPVLDLVTHNHGAAGEFSLLGSDPWQDVGATFGSANDVALLLSTSGTTSRPKLVALLHQNVCAAAENTRTALNIGPEDRCLDVATLFHAHGLVAGVVASLMGGASVMCPPAFDATEFFEWLDEFKPTWYTAVPTVHQAILREAPRHPAIIARQRLKCIRSASAYLPDAVRTQLEETFGTVVTESYGLSEAMQLTNTPLDRNTRKLGSLGVPGSSEIGIMGEDGRLLDHGQSGEIVARGPVVISAYWNRPPDADTESFCNGWFRTGDVGYLDADGHLYMTGRFKDQINRGGEKIAPQEVDIVLLEHPAVSQAMAFGMPHPLLGEDVAAAVVLRPSARATPDEIRRYAKSRLPEFKAPRKIFIVAEIPANATGKLLRRDLIARIGVLDERPRYIAPRNKFERRLAEIWRRILEVDCIGIDDDFFDLGGHSLLAIRLLAMISTELADVLPLHWRSEGDSKIVLQPGILWHAPTLRQLAEYLMTGSTDNLPNEPIMVVQRGGNRVPFIMLTGVWGGQAFYVRKLARYLNPEQPLLAIPPHDLTKENAPGTIEAMAKDFLRLIQDVQPNGPYLLGGYSHSGLIAYEIAKRLEKRGEQVALLFVIDTTMPHPSLRYLKKAIRMLAWTLRWTPKQEGEGFLRWKYRVFHFLELWESGFLPMFKYYLGRFNGGVLAYSEKQVTEEKQLKADLDLLSSEYLKVINQYVPIGSFSGYTNLLVSSNGPASITGDPALGWSKLSKKLRIFIVPGEHSTCLTSYLHIVASHLKSCLNDL